jgi:hypothetical protein
MIRAAAIEWVTPAAEVDGSSGAVAAASKLPAVDSIVTAFCVTALLLAEPAQSSPLTQLDTTGYRIDRPGCPIGKVWRRILLVRGRRGMSLRSCPESRRLPW